MSDSLQYSMQMQDVDVSKPSRTQPASMTSQIAALSVGQCASSAVQVDAETLKNLSPIKKALSDGANSCVRSAKRRPGLDDAQYRIETAVSITSGGNIYVLAIITRIA